jgi:hypothetical protein
LGLLASRAGGERGERGERGDRGEVELCSFGLVLVLVLADIDPLDYEFVLFSDGSSVGPARAPPALANRGIDDGGACGCGRGIDRLLSADKYFALARGGKGRSLELEVLDGHP